MAEKTLVSQSQWLLQANEWKKREQETLAQINALAESKQLTKGHAQELSDMFSRCARALQYGFLSMHRYEMIRADYLASDPAVIAADEQATDNFFPSDTNDFFNS